jgi:cation diffusion facilitator family transporter
MGSERLRRSLKATFLGMGVNVLLALVKIAAGILGQSHALLADGVESFADLFSSLIVWRGLVVAEEPPDEDHPYGHGKAEPIASAFVAGLLLVAAFWIALQSIREIGHPQTPPATFTLVVLIFVVIVKELLFRFVASEGQTVESSAVQTDAWHHRSDAITSLAAAIGISIALIGGPSFAVADDIAALVAAGIIAWNGITFLRPSLSELMDTSPNRALKEKIRKVAEDTVDVARVEKCFVRKMGHQYFVDMHLEVDPEMSVRQAHEVAHRVKDRVREEVPAVRDVLVHIEPSGRS